MSSPHRIYIPLPSTMVLTSEPVSSVPLSGDGSRLQRKVGVKRALGHMRNLWVGFFTVSSVSHAMRGKLEWAQNKVDNFLKDNPSTGDVEK